MKGLSLAVRGAVLPLVIAITSVVALPTVAGAGGTPLKVTTTLDGKNILPHHIHWVARTSFPNQP